MDVKDMNEKQLNMYENLVRQISTTFSHANECSYKTRETYETRLRGFCAFLAVNYNKQSMKRVNNGHIKAYVDYLQDNKHLSTSYVTTTLSAIRYYYDAKTGGKFIIKSNKALGVKSRSVNERIGKDRSMVKEQVAYLKTKAYEKNEGYGLMVEFASAFGTRISETVSLKRSTLNEALYKPDENGKRLIRIKGKGGLVRYLPINSVNEEILKKIEVYPKNGTDRIFLEKGEKTHIKIKAIEKWVSGIRRDQEEYTFHSLRHSFAVNLKSELDTTAKGLSESEKRLIISARLGHGRESVSRIYLESVE